MEATRCHRSAVRSDTEKNRYYKCGKEEVERFERWEAVL
jgi:hypothetical protein